MTALLELQTPTTLDATTPGLETPSMPTPLGQYFSALNSADYDKVAGLFAGEGILWPPFEAGVVGPEAIQQYLSAEAIGMRAFPKTWDTIESNTNPLSPANQRILVRGYVELPLFSVNVAWEFQVTASGAIQSVRVDLLASLEELVKFRR